MSIQRFETGPRMSQVVVNGNTVYLAGVVANRAAGESVTKQTQDILSIIDGHLARAGTDKSKLLTATIYITDMRTFAEMNAVWDAWVSPGNTPAIISVKLSFLAPSRTVRTWNTLGAPSLRKFLSRTKTTKQSPSQWIASLGTTIAFFSSRSKI